MSVVLGTVRAVGPVSFTLAAGECLAVTGPNGSGKSTLLSLVAGRLLPTEGQVSVLGVPAAAARRSRAADLSVLLDGFAVYPDLTVSEHLELIAAAWPGSRLLDTVDGMLRRTDLTTVRGQFPGELSSGESRMFALACAAMRPSRVVVLDEPEQRLDERWRSRAVELIGSLKADGRSVVLATHDATFRAELGDRTLPLTGRAR